MGKCLFLKAGREIDTDTLTATESDIIKDKTAVVNGNDEPVIGTLELTGNSGTGNVLVGKTFYTTNPKTKQTGTMPHNGSISGSLNCGQSKSIPAGYTTGGAITTNSLASQTSATATASYISSGKTAWVNGNKLTGTLATQGGSTTTPGTTNKTIVTAQKHVTGNIIVAGSSNLIASNIKKGVNIFGVTGTWEGYVATAKELYKYGINNGGFIGQSSASSVSQVRFESNQIYMYVEGYEYNEDDDWHDDYRRITVVTNNTYNLTGYNTLTATFYVNANSGSSSLQHFVSLGLSTNKPLNQNSLQDISTKLQGSSVSVGSKTLSLNISSINAQRYISFQISAYGHSRRIESYIYQISLS